MNDLHIDARGVVHRAGEIPGLAGARTVCLADAERWPCRAMRASTEQAGQGTAAAEKGTEASASSPQPLGNPAPAVAPEPVVVPPGDVAPVIRTWEQARAQGLDETELLYLSGRD